MSVDAASAPLLETRDLRKTYGGVAAIDAVDLAIARGEVHALVGENGAGKSTLIRVLTGVTAPDRGVMLVEGRPLVPGDVRRSEEAGIVAVHQEGCAFPDLTAPENVFVGREPRVMGLALDRRRMERETDRVLARLGERIDLRRPLAALPLAARQMVGIARALVSRCRLLILDEPTASLSHREAEAVLRTVRELRASGVSVLYVSHRLEELFEVADRVTVLRDGRRVTTAPIGSVTRSELIRLMVGRAIETEARRPRQSGRPGEGEHRSATTQVAAGESPAREAAPVLAVRGLGRQGAFADVSFDVRAGEIVGLGGLVGAGRSEIVRAIFGVDRPDRGRVLIDGRPLPPGSVRAAMAAGVALVPEDRQGEGLFPPMSVADNLSMACWGALTRFGFVSRTRQHELVDRLVGALAVKTAGPDLAAEALSGGNQQKLVVGRWLARRPRVLLLDEPTRGIDVGARAFVHDLIRSLAAQGVAVLVVSSDLPELLALSDRVLVVREGRIVRELADGATQEDVLGWALPDATRPAGAHA